MVNQFSYRTGLPMADLFFSSFATMLEMQRTFVSRGMMTAPLSAKFGHSDQSRHTHQSRQFEIGATEEQVIPIPKEELRVGKRQVQSAKAYRVSTTVVEVPVEEQVKLRAETVVIERRPTTGTTVRGGESFQDHTIEVHEMYEEPVIGKVVTQAEEMVIYKTLSERTATVRETVRQNSRQRRRASGDSGTAAAGNHGRDQPEGRRVPESTHSDEPESRGAPEGFGSTRSRDRARHRRERRGAEKGSGSPTSRGGGRRRDPNCGRWEVWTGRGSERWGAQEPHQPPAATRNPAAPIRTKLQLPFSGGTVGAAKETWQLFFVLRANTFWRKARAPLRPPHRGSYGALSLFWPGKAASTGKDANRAPRDEEGRAGFCGTTAAGTHRLIPAG